MMKRVSCWVHLTDVQGSVHVERGVETEHRVLRCGACFRNLPDDIALHVLTPGCRTAVVVGYSGYGDGAGFAVDHEVVALVGIAVAIVCQGKVFAEASGADVVGVDFVGIQGADPSSICAKDIPVYSPGPRPMLPILRRNLPVALSKSLKGFSIGEYIPM